MLMQILRPRLMLLVSSYTAAHLLLSSSSLHRQKGKKPFRSLRSLKTDLDLNVEGDLNIVMAFAEKLRAGLHSFVFGRPFYTSMQERDALMSFWLLLSPAFHKWWMDGWWTSICMVLLLDACVKFKPPLAWTAISAMMDQKKKTLASLCVLISTVMSLIISLSVTAVMSIKVLLYWLLKVSKTF